MKKQYTNAEKQQKVAEALGDYLTENLEKNLPLTIAFKPCGIRFDVYGTENEGMMKLTYEAPDKVRLQLGIYRKGTDRLYSNFMPARSAEEMIRYLKDPATHQEWLEQIQHLSDSVDDYWD